MDLSITVSGFKSLNATTFNVRPGVNVFIGPNGSGKTNILRSLKFIRDVLMKGAGLAVARNGGPVRIYNRQRRRIDVVVETSYLPRTFYRSPEELHLRWSFSVAQRGPEQVAIITDEKLKIYRRYSREIERNVFTAEVRRGERTTSTVEMIHVNAVGRDLFSELRTLSPGTKSEAYTTLIDQLTTLLREH